MMAGLARRWPAIRAILIGLGIVISLISGCPIPEASEARLDAPVNRRELERWAETIGRPPEQLRAEVLTVLRDVGAAHDVAMAPFRWWFDLSNTHQKWNLFPLADPDPVRMHVEVQRRGGERWTLLYRPNDAAHTWHRAQLEQRRLRGCWNPGFAGPRRAYGPFLDWLAREVFAEDGRAVAIRVRMRQLHVRDPGEGEPALIEEELDRWTEVRRR